LVWNLTALAALYYRRNRQQKRRQENQKINGVHPCDNDGSGKQFFYGVAA